MGAKNRARAIFITIAVAVFVALAWFMLTGEDFITDKM